ncbi:hypothetical protein GW572_04250 [Clavibacter capsici]|nr:zinc finger-like domain-containing protein [Clavibacter capsici]QIS38592.1 hypothetical protein GW572_04250 [Clavibacter capsici]
MTTADQREQALAAFDRLTGYRKGYNGRGEIEADIALVRAALTPAPLPADLICTTCHGRGLVALGSPYNADDVQTCEDCGGHGVDIPAALAELAELRARPTLTAEQAREILHGWHVDEIGGSTDDEVAAWLALRAIAEGATHV